MTDTEPVFPTRDYRATDAAAVIAIFREAISMTGALAYDPPQVAAWLASADDEKAFIERIEAGWVRVIDDAQGCAGFAQINMPGHLEMLYVAPRASRQGFAAALLDDAYELAGAMGARVLTVDASRIARPMLLKHGFVEKETEIVERVVDGQSVKIECFKMQKALS